MILWIRRLCSVPLAALILVLYETIPNAGADGPVLIDSAGIWTIEKLGYSNLVFAAGGQKDDPAILYALPAGAAQGSDTWYIIHFHFQIEFSDSSNEGLAYVSAATNERAAAQIKFEIGRQPNGSSSLRWSSVDLINGRVEEESSTNTAEVRFSNYLQNSGVQPVVNALTFTLEQFQNAKVETLRIFEDTAIQLTSVSPPRVELQFNLSGTSHIQ